jgi:GntP family gluconate:H+ symporter
MTPLGILVIALIVVVGGVLFVRLHPFVILVVAAFVVALLTPGATESAGRRVAEGFGKTALDIGIVIAMASILGSCLSAAGAAQRIVESIQGVVGARRTPLALLLTAFVLGIPMFAESVFFLLLPLARAVWERTRRHYLLCVLAIVAGATMSHSLVPPTPGPLFVADALGVNIATMIGVGSLVGLAAAIGGLAYARLADGWWPQEPAADGGSPAGGSEPVVPKRLPPLWAALVPIVLPVALISLESWSASAPGAFPAALLPVIRLAGERTMALTLAALAAVGVLAASGATLPAVRRTVNESLAEAGGVLLLIAGGGALGGTLRQAGLQEIFTGLAPGGGLALIPVAWLVTATIRIAQGSATVAMITAAGVMAPAIADGAAACHPVYVAVAIGCGSKMGMWMNDGGFWVISRMSGMSEVQTLRSAAAMVSIEGAVGLLVTLALAATFPLQ